MRFHPLASDVKCPTCGANIGFVRVRLLADLYECASPCKTPGFALPKLGNPGLRLRGPLHLGSVWQVDGVRYARAGGKRENRLRPACHP